MTKQFDLIIKFKDEILNLSLKYGMLEPRVFGSVAKGSENPNDIDILVKASEGKSYFDLIDYNEELEELLGMKVDVVAEKGLSPYMAAEILKSAKEI